MNQEYRAPNTKTAPNDPQNGDTGSFRLQSEEQHGTKKEERYWNQDNSEEEIDKAMRAFGRWFKIRFKQAKFIDFAQAVLGTLVLGVGIVAACVYYGQLKEMRKSTEAATNAAIATCEQVEISRQALISSQRSSEDTRRLVDASVYQAEASAQAETAHIVPTDVELPYVGPKDRTIYVPFNLKNIGKTEAKQFTSKVVAMTIPQGADYGDFSYTHFKPATLDGGLIEGNSLAATSMPNQRASIPLHTKVGSRYVVATTDGPTERDFNEGREDVLLYGTATWRDIFGTKHWHKFCYWLEGKRPGPTEQIAYAKCVNYNQTDSNGVMKVTPSAPHPTKQLPERPCPTVKTPED